MHKTSKKAFFLFLIILLFPLWLTVNIPSLTMAAEAPLTNEDVIKLSKLGFDDEVIISKIMQAKGVAFNLDTDTLIKLKKEGVSPKVISSMLNRGKALDNENELTAKGTRPLNPSAKGIILSTKDGDFELIPIRGNYSSSGFGAIRVRTFSYPGISARIRTRDHFPTFLIASKADLRAAIFVVKLEKDEKNQLRSLRVGGGSAFSRQAIILPHKDLTIPHEMNEEKAGFWRIKFQGDLQPGEYGIYVTTSNTSSILLDFGID